MVALDEDALVCDLAETYGIFDYGSLPADLVATLAVGLRENARIKIKMSETKMPFNDYLLTAIYDRLNWLCWSKSPDGFNGVNMPIRILDVMLGRVEETENDNFETFDSPEDYERARRELLRM